MKTKFITGLLAVTCLAGAIPMQAHSADTTATNTTSEAKPLPAQPDGSYVVLSGTVQDLSNNEFNLKYDGGTIKVDMSDWAWGPDLKKYITNGDMVTVSGNLDDDWFEKRELMAGNIYLQKKYSYYYRYDPYPNNNQRFYSNYRSDDNRLKDGMYVTARGTVKDIAGREFTLTSSDRNIVVDTSELPYDPFDNGGIENGDQIFVSGEIDDTFYETKEIMADVLVITSEVNAPQR